MTDQDLAQFQKAAEIVEQLQIWVSHAIDQGLADNECALIQARWSPKDGVSIEADFSDEYEQDVNVLWSATVDEAETLTYETCLNELRALLGIKSRVQ